MESDQSQQKPDAQENSPELEARAGQWEEVLKSAGLERDDIIEMYRHAVVADNSAEMLAGLGPQTEEELDAWFKDRIGVDLPKVAVCPGHVSPFEIACDIHFFRILRLLWIASRGGSKTSLVAWLDLLAAESFPGFGSFTVGGTGLSQGERKYEHLLPFVVEGGVIGGKELPNVARSTLTMTVLNNGSRVLISPATVGACNGPREPRLHRDERELMPPEVYRQAGNIPAGRETPDGRHIPAQIIDTSTMKWAHGPVAKEKEEYEKALAEGRRPRMIVKTSCIFEIAEEVPNCRSVSKDQREARLKELDRDPCELCDCDTWLSDVWGEDADGEEIRHRTLEDVCAGRLFRSRGFKQLEEIQTLFQENDRGTWEAEQECSQPSKEGVYISSYSQVRCGIKKYQPAPDLGRIYSSIDWGGVDPHFFMLAQLLDRDVEVESYVGERKKILPAGSLVVFAEIFRAGIGNVDIGKMAIAMEDKWRKQWPGWQVHERYYDYQNAAGRMDWEKHLDLKLTTRMRKDFDAEVGYIRNWVGKGKFFVDIEACPMFDKSIRAWRAENGHEVRTAEHNWSTHGAASVRYLLSNLEMTGRKDAVKKRAGVSHRQMLAEPGGGDGLSRRSEAEIIGVGGADPSPNRPQRGRMEDSSWRDFSTHLPES